MSQIEIALPDEAATVALGRRLAGLARRRDVIALVGPLGAGKTTLARGFIQALTGSDEEVPSPTFTLVQTYEASMSPIWHFDLYRVKHEEEAWELGLEEALADGILLVEWPERLGSLLPHERLDVHLTASASGRAASLAGSPSWAERLEALL
jgi:tRNA threonylcarbamoyladenosine biosynthesis protein TsaE